MKDLTAAICERLARIRRDHYGERGRSRFAKDLGITPSTYAHYESDRLPPVDILWKAAQVTQTRLEWLVAGVGERRQSIGADRDVILDPLIERLRAVMQSRPDLAAHVESFLITLQRIYLSTPVAPPSAQRLERPPASDLIPIVGGTSAGTARFWRDLPEAGDGPGADRRLEELLAACLGPTVEAPARFGQGAAAGPVSLVQLSRPDDRGLLEFLQAPEFKARFPACVAWRIDGSSMVPRYLDGDLVIASPHSPAENGHPCVARQRGQLGVNCKIFQQDGPQVRLIPVNDAYPAQVVPEEEVVWAWRVLASVRL